MRLLKSLGACHMSRRIAIFIALWGWNDIFRLQVVSCAWMDVLYSRSNLICNMLAVICWEIVWCISLWEVSEGSRVVWKLHSCFCFEVSTFLYVIAGLGDCQASPSTQWSKYGDLRQPKMFLLYFKGDPLPSKPKLLGRGKIFCCLVSTILNCWAQGFSFRIWWYCNFITVSA